VTLHSERVLWGAKLREVVLSANDLLLDIVVGRRHALIAAHRADIADAGEVEHG